jgi:Mrp family chromosome partitioning ATPase
LQLGGAQGLADVLAGRLTVEEAMQEVSVVREQAGVGAAPQAAVTTTLAEASGSVSVLLGGTAVADPPALLGRSLMTELPRALLEQYDYVFVDAPPPLQVSDVIPLLTVVDGLLIVARVGHTRETSANRLMQFLEQTPSAPVLGVVANAVPQSDIEKYGLSAQYKRGWRHKLSGR